MPIIREMDKPDGLLTILRRAIMDEDANLAATIARRCSQERAITLVYCDFLLRILMEDKFPNGSKACKKLQRMKENFKKNVLLNGQMDMRSKDKKYADIAFTIAKIKTNHKPFEETFNVLYDYLYVHKYTKDNTVVLDEATDLPVTRFPTTTFENVEPMMNKNKCILKAVRRNIRRQVSFKIEEKVVEVNRDPYKVGPTIMHCARLT